MPSVIIGNTYHYLTVLDFDHKRKNINYFRCKCICGIVKVIEGAKLQSGHTWSCGCFSIKGRYNKATHRLAQRWNGMLQRCYNKNHTHFMYYGGRGISVCERWLNFDNFVDDMFPTFQEGLTLDRIDNNAGYSMKNCRWATWIEQNQNHSRYKGGQLCHR